MLDWFVEPLGLTFADLAERGFVAREPVYRKHELGRLRSDGQPGFATPSGKVQLVAPAMADLGVDPLPRYREPPESPSESTRPGGDVPSGADDRSPAARLLPHAVLPGALAAGAGARASAGDPPGDRRRTGHRRRRLGVRREPAGPLPSAGSPGARASIRGWSMPTTLGGARSCPGAEPLLFDSWRPNINLLVNHEGPHDPAFGSTQMRGLLCRVYPAGEGSGD